ncbi:MAG: Hpt domain-containing protein, partial [Gammaproteobacteria bacterium]|nr:Hpt domain-containing protein [Gammaproteobacteria bacterium]
EELSLDSLSLELTDLDAEENEITLDEVDTDNLSLDEALSFDLDTDTLSEVGLTATDEIQEEQITAPPAPEIDAIQTGLEKPETAKEPSLLDDTIDDEIIEIFMEEAEEAYETITNNLPLWVANTANEEPLKEIRRAYHTLKGSGRLVGAADLGEFAWAYENMLNRVIDNTIPANTELLELMELGNNALLELFELFKVNSKPGQNILALMEYADALSQGKSINLNESASVPEELAVEEEAGLEEITLELDESFTDLSEPDEVITLIEPEEEITLDGSSELDIPADLEEELDLEKPLNLSESFEIEETVDDPVQPLELRDTVEIEEQVNETVTEEPLPVEIDPVLLEIYRKEVAVHVETLREYIRSWNDGITTPELSLIRALHTLTGSSRTTGVESLAAVCSSFEHYINHLKENESNVPQVVLLTLEQTISLVEQTVDCLDKPGAMLPAHKALLSRIEALPRDLNSKPQAVTEAPVEAEVAMPDYDEELLEIFLEEGTEILDDSDQVIVDWIANPAENEYVEELQRHLHTLKGGARMAGITELGDLGHSVESLLTAVVDGHMKPSKTMFDLVQRAQDRLVKMLELVQEHKGLAPATDLIAQVDYMLENRGEIDDLEMFNESTTAEEQVELTIPDEPEVEDIPVIDVVEETETPVVQEIKEDVSEGISVEIPELEKLEEELRMEVEGSTSEYAIDMPALDELSLEPEVVTENVIATGIQNEQQVPDVSERQEAAAPDTDHDRRKSNRVQAEQVRVRADLLDNLVNFAGEVSIYRSRLEQQTNNFRYNITEFDETVNRLRDQLRQFEIETETQIEYKNEELSSAQESFDPLEMDRFTTMQHLSRAMMESLGDLDSLRVILNNLTRESETLLLQQSRVNTDLQEGLMRTRMVPFAGQAARLRRIVRQTCGELGKHADLHLHGVDTELDRSVLERIISPIEHMLRNAVAHGIESPDDRKKSGKDGTGNIDFSISNEGSEIVIKIQDDGSGINLEAIRNKAVSKGLIAANAAVTKEMLLDMIMQSGFSTAESVNQIAGRGVGMDVVNTEIKQLGGVFNIDTTEGKGTTFTVSLPLTLAISRALMVMVGDDFYAVPLLSVEGVERISNSKIKEIMASDEQSYNWVGEDYKFMHLGTIMGVNEMKLSDDAEQLPMLMVRSGEHHAAILVDNLLGSREIVVKSVGPQLSTLRGISGATIMGDGSVVLIIDLGMLIRLSATADGAEYIAPMPVTSDATEERTTPLVMVVDDSITVRKVTTRLLERHDMEVVAAKDGVDALSQLQEIIPDIMLLDVEMPRMDGFELATNMRNDERLKDIPIIMITSRTGQKHRDRAASIGVNIYMGKPYTEADLLDNINVLTGKDF